MRALLLTTSGTVLMSKKVLMSSLACIMRRRTECLVHAVERVHVDEGVLRKLESESEQSGSTTDQSWYLHTLMQSEYLRIEKRISW